MLPTVADLDIKVFPDFKDERGVLVPVELSHTVPFPVVRLFWIFDVPPSASRGSHAHKACHQYYICVSGSVQVEAYDGQESRTITLAAGNGLHVPPMIFTIERFNTSGSMLMVLCDRPYEIDDYLVNREAFTAFRRDSSASY
jgi:dTDP-4-dehydrorhamnose 3,5-epimerase-like enzyme